MTQPAQEDSLKERLRIHRFASGEDTTSQSFAADVRDGLTSTPKRLFPKYFYDELGSHLFDAICLLPEYYLTRAEDEILSTRADEMVACVAGERITLVEFGSGSAVKTRAIIEALLRRQAQLTYVPIDISVSALEASARSLLQSYPSLRISAYASDYQSVLDRVRRSDLVGETGARLLALFLGSNIGNFDAAEARAFLRAVRRGMLEAGDALLLGADLKKERSLLEAAYDDALGVTAAFNLNLLARINRELDADFNPRDFRHVALYNEPEGRIEIYVESRRAQRVRLRQLNLTVAFDEGERMHTENSYKYDADALTQLAAATGFRRAQAWLDAAARFSSNLFVAEEEANGRAVRR